MALPTPITIKESISELRSLQRNHGELIKKRLQVLIEIKKAGESGISKRALSSITGVNHNSILKWRKMYQLDGIQSLLTHGRKGGYKPSVITSDAHTAIEKKLNDPKNGIRGYVELLDWVNTELLKDVKYITLVKYVERHFGSKIKVARKSHINKDMEKVEAFKKTSVKSVKK
ncbi:MAG: hypothetical protein ABJB11_21300 [Ferruginibacter sp.]